MKPLQTLFILFVSLGIFGCSEKPLETPLSPEEQKAQQYIEESEAAVAVAEKEIEAYAQNWVGTRNTVTVPGGSVDALAEAIAEAGAGGTVVLAGGAHTETGPVMINQRVKIIGEENAALLFPNAPSPMGIPLDVVPSLYIKDANRVWLEGFSISTGTAQAGRIAVLVQNSPNTRIEGMNISGFQHGILIDGGSRSQIIDNILTGIAGEDPAAAYNWGISNGTGRRVLMTGNEIVNYDVNIFFSDRNGLAFSNTMVGGQIGVIWCTLPPWQVYPDGEPLQAAEPSNNWRAYNNTAIGADFNYLIVDGATNSLSIQNESIDAGLYDIEIAGVTERFGAPVPPSSSSFVISVGDYIDYNIKDCTGDNLIIGGSLVDTAEDPCF